MLSKFLLFLFISSFLIFASPIKAFEPFVKSSSNPLPFSNNFPNWNEMARWQPSVILDGGIYKMWYASYNGSNFKIIYATSQDGISWNRQNLLDVYPEFDNHDPAMLKTPNGYRLFFVASTNGGSQNFKIYKIDSTDGFTFDANSRQLILQPTGGLEANAVSSPTVIFENGTYYLFYLCWGNQGFKICLATSTDGNQWQRCQNNPIINEVGDGPNIFAKGGRYYLYFQSALGVRQTESSDNLSCTMSWSNIQTVLPEIVIGPSVLDNQNILHLYYSGYYQTGLLINLATSNNQTSPTPTNTLNPTHTPSPTPNIIKNKMVIIPGLMASWNKEAMLHNEKVSQDKWSLLPFVKEYDGLSRSLQNLHYKQGEDLFIFAYDWRKNLDALSDDLNQFLTVHDLTNSQIDLVGHSLGGLVARIYGQKYGLNSIHKIITVGTPHLGTAHAYKPLEAGEIEKEDSLFWFIKKLALMINRKRFKTDKETIESIMPITKDLFPIYDFLTNKNGNVIPIQSMKIRNNTLINYSTDFFQLFDSLTTITGEKGSNTLFGYEVVQRTLLDILLDNYPDGRPVENRFDLGDNVITSYSSSAGDDRVMLPADHGEIIYESQAITTILDKLNVAYDPIHIVEGKRTKISPSLIFVLLSPAEIQVEFNSEDYLEQEGLIFVENAQAGEYKLKVTGKLPGGPYTVLVGQVSDSDDKWFDIYGEINNLVPFLQTDTFTIFFNPPHLLDYPVNQNDIESLFDLLIQRMNLIRHDYVNSFLDNGIDKVKQSKTDYLENKFSALQSHLLECQHNIFKARRNTSTIYKNELYDLLNQLENLYERSLENSTSKPGLSSLQYKLNQLSKNYESAENWLLQKKDQGEDVTEQALSLSLAREKLTKASNSLKDQNLLLTEITLESVKDLLKEVRE